MPYRKPEALNNGHERAGFDCGKRALNEWLQKHALAGQASGSARVYVTTEADSDVVAGYYALAAAQVDPEDAPSRLGKGQPKHRPIPVVLLARLAVDLHHQGAGLGRSLLLDAMARALGAAETIGLRALLVHAKDEEAREWYAHYGFVASPTDAWHMVLLMKEVRATFESPGV